MLRRLLPATLLSCLLLPAAALASPGQINPAFTSGGFNNSATGKIAYLSDGDLIASGSFNFYDNASGISNLVRINPDGSKDATLSAQGTGFNNSVLDFDVRSDGKIWAVGSFTQFNNSAGNGAKKIVLLNADGTRDTAFSTAPTGPTGAVAADAWAVTAMPDGDVLVGGFFDTYNGNSTGSLIRFDPNGSVDSGWAAATSGGGTDGLVRDIDTCPNGKIMVSGDFTSFNGNSAYNRVLRLNADGTLDTGFQKVGTGVSAGVDSVECLSSGKVIIGGGFTNYNGTTRLRVMRLNSDGSLDPAFETAPGPDSTVLTIAELPTGKIAIGGLFSTVGGQARRRLAQLNSDGSLDSSFTVGTGVCSNIAPTPCVGDNPRVNSLAVDINGNLMVSGEMRYYNDSVASQLVLLRDSARLPVSVTGSGTVTSTPAGISCPGVCSAWFDQGQTVTMAASPAVGNVFSSWSDGCSGSGACSITTGGVSVGAQFSAAPAPNPSPDPNPDPNPDPTPDPAPSLAVSGTKSKISKKGAYITSVAKVNLAGKITQAATSGTGKKLKGWCETSKTTAVAGSHTLKCNLGKKGRKALTQRSLKLTLKTSFTPTSGKVVSVTKKITIKKKR